MVALLVDRHGPFPFRIIMTPETGSHNLGIAPRSRDFERAPINGPGGLFYAHSSA